LTQPYNPIEPENLAESVVRALLRGPCHALPPAEAFDGPGIYLLYYSGTFPAYRRASLPNKGGACELPIYVGRAKPKGGRKGKKRVEKAGQQPLYERLRKHEQSIGSTSNLAVAEFRCRYLVVADLWVPLAENLLINQYRPLWNVVIDGFGNNDPGGGRYKQKRSDWDVLHPGRPWVQNLAAGKRLEAALHRAVEEHYADSQ
jgi:hypothetical protein